MRLMAVLHSLTCSDVICMFFFFNDTATTEIYTLSLHDALPISFQTDTTRVCTLAVGSDEALFPGVVTVGYERHCQDRKSTRLNSSHGYISYAVFCLKKKTHLG